MRRLTCILVLLSVIGGLLRAETWDYIQTSGEYYYGIGTGATEEIADKAALADLVSRIATHVSSDFTQIDDIATRNGNMDHQERVLNCVRTYSQSTLTNAEKWPAQGKAPNITVRRYMKKSELQRIFDNRIAKAKNMYTIAEECMENRKVDMALQYYYWAYSLIRSVQFPNEIKDERGRNLVDWIPLQIDRILSDVDITLDKKDGDCVDLLFKYKGESVSSLEFSYSDGRTICQGLAKDGRGMIEMVPGYETDSYHLDIEYEYKGQARGDAEMESVLNVITRKVFPKASVMVRAPRHGDPLTTAYHAEPETENTQPAAIENPQLSRNENPHPSDMANPQETALKQAINGIITALQQRKYDSAAKYFTPEGWQIFQRLTSYGKARVLDTSNIRYFQGLNGKRIARGLTLSFSFSGSRKKTFVEDLSFTFDPNDKIENIAFGLGEMTESSIFNSRAQWSDEVREIIVSFMENYKTAYSLERIDYIRQIFADDAVIIVGKMAKKATANKPVRDGMGLSLNGKNLITYNRYSKDSYIANLEKCFNRNDFINLRFTNHQIQWLEKYNDQAIFAINIRQEYNSSTYADDGYLFLLVDMTDTEEPQIKVRTWQPNEVDIDKLYNAGDFFND